MKNKWTTVVGILLIVGAVATAAGQVLSGEVPDFKAIMELLGGIGFLKAGDGGL